ncbi:MAG TPA: endonuclease/exonuclease/phosphatase family protein [Candidatus Acidoferrales bacterium]|nr:endonuclease/exonuclease/phosphatase family protein [Candidatus Acidoferrales bacterium]
MVRSFTAASYNIHQCVGVDRKRDPRRVARVIEELKADIIGLQEVDYRPLGDRKSYQLNYLAEVTGLNAIAGPTIQRPAAEFGNALLTRHRIIKLCLHDISVPRRQPRGAIDALIDVHGQPVRVLVTHFGLSGRERRRQVLQIMKLVENEAAPLTLLLGDLNEWWPPRFSVRNLNARLGRASAPRTFPSRFPLFALDRIWVSPHEALVETKVIKTPLARIASDHLPLRATISFAGRPIG